jgi:hypothetical protein
MRISLDLSRHCIETELRRRHDRTVAEALRPSADLDRLAAEISLLRSALEGLDFPGLRAGHAALNAESRAEVDVDLSFDRRRIRLRVDGKTVGEAPALEVP